MNYKIVDGDIPTVFATMKDMDEFATFIEKCEAKGIHKYGLFKVGLVSVWFFKIIVNCFVLDVVFFLRIHTSKVSLVKICIKGIMLSKCF